MDMPWHNSNFALFGSDDSGAIGGMVDLEEPDARDEDEILQLVTRHKQYTGSLVAEFVLGDWERLRRKFVKVIPGDYKIALKKIEEEHQLLTEPTETQSAGH
jgi:glutamate synthase domain-containing protein 3